MAEQLPWVADQCGARVLAGDERRRHEEEARRLLRREASKPNSAKNGATKICDDADGEGAATHGERPKYIGGRTPDPVSRHAEAADRAGEPAEPDRRAEADAAQRDQQRGQRDPRSQAARTVDSTGSAGCRVVAARATDRAEWRAGDSVVEVHGPRHHDTKPPTPPSDKTRAVPSRPRVCETASRGDAMAAHAAGASGRRRSRRGSRGLICTVNSFGWLNRPSPVSSCGRTCSCPRSPTRDWTGYRPAFRTEPAARGRRRAGDSASEVYRAAERAARRDSVALRVPRPTATTTLPVPTMRLTVASISGRSATTSSSASCSPRWASSSTTCAPTHRARAPCWQRAAPGVCTSSPRPTSSAPAWFRPLCLVLQALGPMTLVHLALTFPIERLAVRRRWLLPLLYGAGLAIGVVHNLALRAFAAVLLHRSAQLRCPGRRRNSAHRLARRRLPAPAVGGSPAAHEDRRARRRRRVCPPGGRLLRLLPGRPQLSAQLRHLFHPAVPGRHRLRHRPARPVRGRRDHPAHRRLGDPHRLLAAIYLSGVGLLDALFAGRGRRVAQLLFLLAIVALVNPLRDRVQAGVDRCSPASATTTAPPSPASAARWRGCSTSTRSSRRSSTPSPRHARRLRRRLAARRERRVPIYARAGPPSRGALPQQLATTDALVQLAAPERALTDEGAARRRARRRSPGSHATLVVPIAFERRPPASSRWASRNRAASTRARIAACCRRSPARRRWRWRTPAPTGAELRSTQAQLIQSERFAAIGEVSAAVAHGIRNPLAGIKAAARVAGIQVGAEHPPRETHRRHRRESNKLEARIKALLDFAKPFEPHRAPVASPTAGGGRVRPARAARGARRRARGRRQPACRRSVDRAQIVEVLLVLMSNAIEAMPSGGALSVAARRDDAPTPHRRARHRPRHRSPRNRRGCFISSPPPRPPAPGSAWRSPRRSSKRTAARSPSTAQTARARCSRSRCRLPEPIRISRIFESEKSVYRA